MKGGPYSINTPTTDTPIAILTNHLVCMYRALQYSFIGIGSREQRGTCPLVYKKLKYSLDHLDDHPCFNCSVKSLLSHFPQLWSPSIEKASPLLVTVVSVINQALTASKGACMESICLTCLTKLIPVDNSGSHYFHAFLFASLRGSFTFHFMTSPYTRMYVHVFPAFLYP